MQTVLPFKNLRVPDKHIQWLAQANAADYYERKLWFYPFKTRFLRRHAITDGLDLQTIVIKCWCGDGIWRGMDDTLPQHLWQRCHKCSGTGIYLTKHIVLIRWLIKGLIFHEPSNLILHPSGNEYRNTFDGRIQHPPVDPKVGRRAMERLMLRYEPNLLLALWRRRWENARDSKVWAWKSRYRRFRASFQRAQPDDVPF